MDRSYQNPHVSNPRMNYLYSQLNNSPSKASYSFSRSQRFIDLPQNQHTSYHQPQYQQSHGYRYDLNHERQKRNRTHENQNISRSKSKSKTKSPNRNKASPYKNNQSKSKHGNYKYYGQSSPKKNHQKTISPGRNTVKMPSNLNNGLNNNNRMGFYYPTGIQINKDGKYVVSNFENVKTNSFGKNPKSLTQSRELSRKNDINLGPGQYQVSGNSPGKYFISTNRNNTAQVFSKSPRKGFENKSYDTNFGPGMYEVFSQFGKPN